MRSYLQPFVVALALLALSVESRDISEGRENPNDVLIHSSHFEGNHFEWRGDNMISRWQLRNRDPSDTIRFSRSGGLRDNFLTLSSERRQANADVFIYSRPQNYSTGRLTADSNVVRTARLTGVAPYNFTYWSPYNAVRVELVDLTNGTGAHVNFDGLLRRTVSGQITSQLSRGKFDFAMTVHAEIVRPNHFQSGTLRSTSVQINSDVITAKDITEVGWFYYPLPKHTFDFVRLQDLTDGTAGRVMTVWPSRTDLGVHFAREHNTTYLLQVHGTPRQ